MSSGLKLLKIFVPPTSTGCPSLGNSETPFSFNISYNYNYKMLAVKLVLIVKMAGI